jgi:hypothetical protein
MIMFLLAPAANRAKEIALHPDAKLATSAYPKIMTRHVLQAHHA